MTLSEYWIQLFELQKELKSLLHYSTNTEIDIEKYLDGTIEIENSQKIDFVVEFPYLIDNSRGIVIEIDGPCHENARQIFTDNNRDIATEKAKFGRAFRIKTNKWENVKEIIKKIKYLENHSYFQELKQNFKEPLYLSEEGLHAMEITLMPFAIARIQKTVIYLIMHGILDIHAKEWNIAVLEKDIPCAEIAFKDLIQFLDTLSSLQGNKTRLPEIKICVQSDIRFKKSRFYTNKKIQKEINYDLFLDISILQRIGLTNIDPAFNAKAKVQIRSSFSSKKFISFVNSTCINYTASGYQSTLENDIESDQIKVNNVKKLLQDIFRIENLNDSEIRALDSMLQRKSAIAIRPSVNSWVYQLASLLQPAFSVIIYPSISFITNLYENLLNNGIDAAFMLDKSWKQKEKRKSLDMIKNNQSLFVCIAAVLFNEISLSKILSETNLFNSKNIGYFIIENAHSISEWGHDFRISYTSVGNNLKRYCKTINTIPFLSITDPVSFDVLSDIQREFGMAEDKNIFIPDKYEKSESYIKVIETNAEFAINDGINEFNKHQLEKAKLKLLVDELRNAAVNFTDINQQGNEFWKNSIMIICPSVNGYLGIESTLSYIKYHFPDSCTLNECGLNTEKDGKTCKYIQVNILNNRLKLTITTKEFYREIKKENFRYFLFVNYPDSIDQFFQIVNRNHPVDNLPTNILILFNKQQLSVNEEQQKVRLNRKNARNTIERSIDKDIIINRQKYDAKSIRKEKQVLMELLTEIKNPTRKISDYIEERILEVFSIDLELQIRINPENRQLLYINPDYGSIYLDRDNLPFHNARTPQTIKIADFIKQIIVEEKPDGISAYMWLNQYMHSNQSSPGIETLLENDKSAEKFQIIIPFINNGIENITKYLNDNHFDFTERMVFESQKDCCDKVAFIQNLERIYYSFNHKTIHISDKLFPSLWKIFSEIRNEEDTVRAMYRLSMIGIIDDYHIDPVSKIISVTVTRKMPGFYSNQLKKYVLQYNCRETAEENLDQLSYYQGNSELQKCLNFLLVYIYEGINLQCDNAVDLMEKACIAGLQVNSDQVFKQFAGSYINSKYTLPIPVITDKKTNFTIVEKYMNIIKSHYGEINKLKQLERTTKHTLAIHPANTALILLKAFSLFLIEKDNDESLTAAQNDYIKGFMMEREHTGDNPIMLKNKMDVFKQTVNKLDTGMIAAVEEAENIVLLTIHTAWLKNFNDNFINI